MRVRLTVLAWASLVVVTPLVAIPADAGQHNAKLGEVREKAIRFLRQSQAADGSWSAERSIGITGVVVTGLLTGGQVPRTDPMVVKALGYIEKLVNAQDGHIAGPNPRQQLKNYVTSINVMALAAANEDGKYTGVVRKGARFLTELQWDEGENKSPKDQLYGGFGYDSKNRPDLSNSQFALEALKSAGVSPDDPAYKRAVIFLNRCQNLKSEVQDQPWADKLNDGSFVYNPAESKAAPDGTVEAMPGYGSMTYAGIKSLIYANVDKNDFRVKNAIGWIRKNYTFAANPGMPKGREQQGLFYYYHTMAKTVSLLSWEEFEDDKGKKHDWKADLVAALAQRQQADGSFINAADRWFEGDANLVTGYALMALGFCQK